jgi:hypothetical protein
MVLVPGLRGCECVTTWCHTTTHPTPGEYTLKKLFPVYLVVPTMFIIAGLVSLGGHPVQDSPAAADVALAERTADRLIATLVTAVVKETNETTAANVEEGNGSFNLLWADCNRDMRLVGRIDPLGSTNRPQGQFERDALDAALAGDAYSAVDFERGAYYFRSSVPLSNFAPQCALCHSAYAALPATDYVGAMMVRVPIGRGN